MKKLIFALVFVFLFSFLPLAFGQETKEETPYIEVYVEIICEGPWGLTWGNLSGAPHGETQGQDNYVYGPFNPEVYFGDLMVMLVRMAPSDGRKPLVLSILVYTDTGLNVASGSTYDDYIFVSHKFIYGQPGPNRPIQNREQLPIDPDKTEDYDPRSFCRM